MMKTLNAHIITITLLTLCTQAFVQVSSAQDDMPDTDKETMTKWQSYAAPGEAHQVLGKLVGTWDYSLEWWDAPDAEPDTATGQSEKEWMLGGRFLVMDHEGEWAGQAYEGFGLKGYDNAKKDYNTVWIDNTGTGMATTKGTYDKASKKLIENGISTDSVTGQQKHYKGVTTFVDDDTYTYEYFTQGPDGNEFRQMEIIYTRWR